jgi:hypothetical protein
MKKDLENCFLTFVLTKKILASLEIIVHIWKFKLSSTLFKSHRFTPFPSTTQMNLNTRKESYCVENPSFFFFFFFFKCKHFPFKCQDVCKIKLNT